MFPPSGIPDQTTPLGTAFIWWNLLLNEGNCAELRAKTWNADAWGDFGWALDALDGMALKQDVEYPDDGSTDIAYVGFIESPGQTVRSTQDSRVDVKWLTVINPSDSAVAPRWVVWGLNPDWNTRPDPEHIRRNTT
jgi:hypothetical protein